MWTFFWLGFSAVVGIQSLYNPGKDVYIIAAFAFLILADLARIEDKLTALINDIKRNK